MTDRKSATSAHKKGDKRLGEGGAKDRRSSITDPDDDPALEKENRQAVKTLFDGAASMYDRFFRFASFLIKAQDLSFAVKT